MKRIASFYGVNDLRKNILGGNIFASKYVNYGTFCDPTSSQITHITSLNTLYPLIYDASFLIKYFTCFKNGCFMFVVM